MTVVLLKDLLLSFLYLSVGFLIIFCVKEPISSVIPLALTTLAIIATLCGLCLRLASVIEEAEDKRLALHGGEKCFTVFFLFSIFVSAKVCFSIVEKPGITAQLASSLAIIKWVFYVPVILLIMIAFVATMYDVGTLIFRRGSKWIERDRPQQ